MEEGGGEEGGRYRGREGRLQEGKTGLLFLSQLFEDTGFSCHIQKEDSVEVGQMRGKGMLDEQ